VALPDPAASRAVLIGVDRYAHLEPLAPVAAAVAVIAGLLREPSVLGLPPEHVTVVDSSSTTEEALAAVRDAAQASTDMLFVYFAGHGLRNRQGDRLYLALREADDEHPDIGTIRYRSLRGVMDRAGTRARRKIVVLDCCYSGLAGAMGPHAVTRADLSRMLGPAETGQATDRADIGTYVLTSATTTGVSLAPPDARFPEFSGELIDVLDRGITGAGPFLQPGLVWRTVHDRLTSRGGAEPQQFGQNAAIDQDLFVNRANQPAAAGSRQPPPGIPAARGTSRAPAPAPPAVRITAEPVTRPDLVRSKAVWFAALAACATIATIAAVITLPRSGHSPEETSTGKSPPVTQLTAQPPSSSPSRPAPRTPAHGPRSAAPDELRTYEAAVPGPGCAPGPVRWTLTSGTVSCGEHGATYRQDSAGHSPFAEIDLNGHTLPQAYDISLEASRLGPATCVAVWVKTNIALGACATGNCYIARYGTTPVNLALRRFPRPGTILDLSVHVSGSSLRLSVSDNVNGASMVLAAQDAGRDPAAGPSLDVHTISSADSTALLTDFRLQAAT